MTLSISEDINTRNEINRKKTGGIRNIIGTLPLLLTHDPHSISPLFNIIIRLNEYLLEIYLLCIKPNNSLLHLSNTLRYYFKRSRLPFTQLQSYNSFLETI